MAEIVGEMNQLPEERKVITKELLEDAIKSKQNRDDIIVKSFTIKEGCGKGENYSSITFAVKVCTVEDGVDCVHNLFIKTLHSNAFIREHSLTKSKVFFRERMVYSQIVTDMVADQVESGVEVFGPSMPEYYYSIADDSDGIVILEDVRPHGYILGDRINGLDFNHCQVVMKRLAQFHALSFAIKNKDPTNLKKYKYLLVHSLFGSSLPGFITSSLRTSVELIKQISDNPKIKERVDNLLKLDLMKTFTDLVKPEEPYAVICHGDLWCSNILFKYEEITGGTNVQDAILLDFQLTRYSSPVIDLSYFLYMSTTKSTRNQHFTDLLRLYHSTFTECLTKLNLEFAEFTFSMLQNLFKEKMMFGVLMACSVISGVIIKQENIEGSVGGSEKEFAKYVASMCKEMTRKENLPLVKERLIGAVEDAVEMGVL